MNEHLRNENRIGLLAVENNPKIFQHVGTNLKDNDETTELTYKNNEKKRGYASERHFVPWCDERHCFFIYIYINH